MLPLQRFRFVFPQPLPASVRRISGFHSPRAPREACDGRSDAVLQRRTAAWKRVAQKGSLSRGVLVCALAMLMRPPVYCWEPTWPAIHHLFRAAHPLAGAAALRLATLAFAPPPPLGGHGMEGAQFTETLLHPPVAQRRELDLHVPQPLFIVPRCRGITILGQLRVAEAVVCG